MHLVGGREYGVQSLRLFVSLLGSSRRNTADGGGPGGRVFPGNACDTMAKGQKSPLLVVAA